MRNMWCWCDVHFFQMESVHQIIYSLLGSHFSASQCLLVLSAVIDVIDCFTHTWSSLDNHPIVCGGGRLRTTLCVIDQLDVKVWSDVNNRLITLAASLCSQRDWRSLNELSGRSFKQLFNLILGLRPGSDSILWADNKLNNWWLKILCLPLEVF